MIPRRIVHGILVLSTLSALSFWLSRDIRRDERATIGGLDTSLNYAMRDFEARYFDEQGRLAARVEAPLLANDASTGIGRTFQIRSQYSPIARSDENRPMRAVLRMDLRHHCPVSRQARSTSDWQAM